VAHRGVALNDHPLQASSSVGAFYDLTDIIRRVYLAVFNIPAGFP
jgi:hypothetical protein